MNRKELIVATAKELFAKNGYAGTSIDDIVKPCKITKSSLYYHFKDKHQLYESILESGLKELADDMETNVAGYSNEEDQIKSYIMTFVRHFEKDRYLASIFMREMSNGAEYMPPSAMKHMLRTLGILTGVIKRGAEREQFKCVEPMLMQMMIVGSISFLINTENLRKRVHDDMSDSDMPEVVMSIEKASEKIVTMILNTLRRSS